MDIIFRRIVLISLLIFLISVSVAGDAKPLRDNALLFLGGIAAIIYFEIQPSWTRKLNKRLTDYWKKKSLLGKIVIIIFATIAIYVVALIDSINNWKS